MSSGTTTPAGLLLAGKTVLVTGASRGIGRATALAAHREGAYVVAHWASSEQAAHDLQLRLGDRGFLVRADLRDPGETETLWQEALAWRGRVDVLVNNAGAWLESPLEDPTRWHQGWADNLALNLTGPADLSRNAVLHFREHGGGIVVSVSSRSAHRGDDAEHLAYGAAKAGLLALTKGIARGFAADGVLAYSVAPGWVATDLAEAGAADAASVPLGEVTPPQDVAEMIVFLASGRSRHTTGATIDITGADYIR
ncbi:SDR family NAD(P)-dependent oxidoreductase [Streptomyces fulvoviolaceus]|uniref:SDR family NAD(P)-dependent oxidoreductase n=1 Tax=Streptomyces fulvoviolaceus TaxID=285535 RepID=UPI0021BE556A|nr:SDR family oxidoreductase [Streptomyces fulvoviolaceus]MCT9077084.1 SDR family oxidoreductase [Streptomyces fulvoviolaceus]